MGMVAKRRKRARAPTKKRRRARISRSAKANWILRMNVANMVLPSPYSSTCRLKSLLGGGRDLAVADNERFGEGAAAQDLNRRQAALRTAHEPALKQRGG